MDKKRDLILTLSGVVVAIAVLVVLLGILRNSKILPFRAPGTTPGVEPIVTAPFDKMETFKSDEEFKEYMQKGGASASYGRGVAFSQSVMMDKAAAPNAVGSLQLGAPETGGGGIPERVSQTNTQVLGIDEPDIFKTDGTNMYYSTPYQYWEDRPIPVPMIDDRGIELQSEPMKRIPDTTIVEPEMYPMPPQKQGGVMAIKAFPPTSLSVLSNIKATGDLLLSENMLLVFNEQDYSKRTIDGYDVTNPNSPVKKWSIPFKQNSYRVEGRLYKNRLYLITRVDMGGSTPCPVQPFDLKTGNLDIPCTSIYYPPVSVSTDAIYTVARINPLDGKIEESVSFVGSNAETAVYMSRNALYLTYHYSGDLTQIMYAFVSQNSDLFSKTVVEKLGKLQGYDISQEAKMMELSSIIARFMSGMDQDKRLVFENNMENRAKQFMLSHARDLDKTGIVKVGADNLKVEATGSVPGQVLNQFSLDEHEGNLRIATTVGQNSWIGGFGQVTDSFSDVYVLDGGLGMKGSVQDLGKKERIYSVRFLGDRGYVVTFRQTDPFYVLDLSNASNPQLKGELKIPGYSSYLHPLTTDVILGIGRDGSKVKLSLFDVANPTNPQEIDNYQLSEYWSEALDNHHAFLADEKHNVFFMPGSKGGYVFSYAGNKISLTKAVADVQVQRAAYINNYLYIVGQNSIVVLDENSWSKAGELSL